MIENHDADERGLLRILLEVAAVDNVVSDERSEKLLGEVCRYLGAELIYTVLGEGGVWSKTGYDANGALGTVPLTRPTGVVRHVLSKRTRILQPRLSDRGAFHRHQDGWPGRVTASYLAVPIHRPGRIRGVLVLLRDSDRTPFGLDDIARAELLAEALAIRCDLGERISGLERLSRTDGLTQLPNYRWARELLAREMMRAGRLDEPLSIVMIDVFGLKDCSRRQGFLACNDILIRIGHAIGRATRGSDTAARFGGDTFLLVLPATDRSGAERVAERICEVIPQELGQNPWVGAIRISHGIACFPEDGVEYPDLITAATPSVSESPQLSPGLPFSPTSGVDGKAA